MDSSDTDGQTVVMTSVSILVMVMVGKSSSMIPKSPLVVVETPEFSFECLSCSVVVRSITLVMVVVEDVSADDWDDEVEDDIEVVVPVEFEYTILYDISLPGGLYDDDTDVALELIATTGDSEETEDMTIEDTGTLKIEK